MSVRGRASGGQGVRQGKREGGERWKVKTGLAWGSGMYVKQSNTGSGVDFMIDFPFKQSVV